VGFCAAAWRKPPFILKTPERPPNGILGAYPSLE
jgi:hypothetical protein